MSEDEFDRMLAEKIKASMTGKCLSDSFKERLVRSVRRRRTFRIKLLAGIGILAVLCLVLAGVARTLPPERHGEACLVATNRAPDDSKLTGWMLISCIRECFKRTRNSRKEEED